MTHMSLSVLIGLILCNVVWSGNPAMSKLVLADFPPALAAWLRYTSALAAYLLATLPLVTLPRRTRNPARKEGFGPPFLRHPSRRDLVLVSAIGLMSFCFAPLMQLTGLQSSRATDNALIVAMEPLMTVLLAWIFVGERITRAHLLGFALALSGFTLLTGPGASATGESSHLLGNLLMVTALIGEASYSVLSLKLLDRHPPLGVFGAALAVGVGILTVCTSVSKGPRSFFSCRTLLGKALWACFGWGPLAQRSHIFIGCWSCARLLWRASP